MQTTFIQGTLTAIAESFQNPDTGEWLAVNGDYYKNDTLVDGGPGAGDLLVAIGPPGDENNFFCIEDSQGALLLDGFEVFDMGPGDDILFLASTTHVLGSTNIFMGSGDDLVWSGAGDDNVFGTGGSDTLHGGAGNDSVDGGTEDDVLIGGSGDDTLDGGAAFDTAVYHGIFASYAIADNAGVLTVVDNVGADGTDTVSNVEVLQFANGTYSMGVFTPSVAPVPAMGALGLVVTMGLLALCGAWTLRRRAASTPGESSQRG